MSLPKMRKKTIPYIIFDSKGYGTVWDIPLDLTENEIESERWYPRDRVAYKLPYTVIIPKHWRSLLVNCTIIQIYGRNYLIGTMQGVRMKDVLASYNNLISIQDKK